MAPWILTLPSKIVSLAECLNSRKENGNDEDDIDADISSTAADIGVKKQDRQDSDGSEAINIGAIFELVTAH